MQSTRNRVFALSFALMPARPHRANIKCCKHRCPNATISLRARFCAECFKANAKSVSLKRRVHGGNCSAKGKLGNRGNGSAKGKLGNKGNDSAKGKLGNKGNGSAKGKLGNDGNGNAKGSVGNRGNRSIGWKKKQAAKRSSLRRSTKTLLVVKNPWLELILSKQKTWEIRDAHTTQRGKVHLALSGAGGLIVGQCQITDSVAIDKDILRNNFSKHRIQDLSIVKYRRPHAWVMSKVRRYRTPFRYSHPQGAIKWVNL